MLTKKQIKTMSDEQFQNKISNSVFNETISNLLNNYDPNNEWDDDDWDDINSYHPDVDAQIDDILFERHFENGN